MQPGMFLTVLVALVCGMRLLEAGNSLFSKKQIESTSLQDKTEKIASTRDDWYVYFQCSTLTGTAGVQKQPPGHNATAKVAQRKSQRRRPVARL